MLLTGGPGVISASAVTELLRRGHTVRLLSRQATRDVQRWNGVEPFDGDIRERASIRNAAANCDVAVHIAGIVAEEPPDRTFDAINVAGTRNVVEESTASRVRRFVFVSSLGTDTGTSSYHRSKREAEAIVKASSLSWTIVRPGNVYGPSDSVMSAIVKMLRSLPAVPMVSAGDQPFQPIWHEDLAKAIATVVERAGLAGEILEVAGAETTSINDVIARLSRLTGRKSLRVPLPPATALPIDETKLQLLRAMNVMRGENAMVKLGIETTPLDDGLRALMDALPEQLPNEGVGSLERKRFRATITGSRYNAVSLMSRFRESFADIIPLDLEAEPHATTHLAVGNTLTMALPIRGNVQVRVELIEPARILLATIEGHPIAGSVHFSARDVSGGVEFAVDTHSQSANVFDFVAMKLLGTFAQDANWKHVVERVVDLSGGIAKDGVQKSSEKLDERAAARVEEKLRAAIRKRQRDESERPASGRVEHIPQR